MEYEIVTPPRIAAQLKQHLLGDRSREQFAITLCGTHEHQGRVRFLARHVLALRPEQLRMHSPSSVELAPDEHRRVLQMASRHGLSQVDWHTHPGDEPRIAFSRTDDAHEQQLATYLADRLPGTRYASVVTNGAATAARAWEGGTPVPITPPRLEGAFRASTERIAACFDRQARAFGIEAQRRLAALRIGMIGVGGLGSILTEQLTRLGVRDWVLVDPDAVDVTSLNRLVGSTPRDAAEEHAKVCVAARTIMRAAPTARVKTFRASVSAPRALRALTTCDLLVAATDNHGSRLIANALSTQYIRPLVHAGVNLEPDEQGFADISGEVAITKPGTWCLLCAGIINPDAAGREWAAPQEKSLLHAHGYLPTEPSPAVYHLNGVTASLAATAIHNLVSPYKPHHDYIIYRELQHDLLSVTTTGRDDCPHCNRLGLGDHTPAWRPQSQAA